MREFILSYKVILGLTIAIVFFAGIQLVTRNLVDRFTRISEADCSMVTFVASEEGGFYHLKLNCVGKEYKSDDSRVLAQFINEKKSAVRCILYESGRAFLLDKAK